MSTELPNDRTSAKSGQERESLAPGRNQPKPTKKRAALESGPHAAFARALFRRDFVPSVRIRDLYLIDGLPD